ncbi:hypothetical protein SCP_0606070 [Sparassis crispa]|uniref:Beach-domain-containing protein n=1 Tax=Sparassis crispa TaxID=139825 RepID=A0A401GQW6_9APHY|nr:hypothetical protein SCP_0606070 [Sparassis crispa]GBE84628.1 hypothetical protein SCP_0606070 [Sparassis crispa]
MLQSILSPFSARFTLPVSPRPGTSTPISARPDELAPEDFARDVLIEVMRNSVENLKIAEGLKARTEVLSEIHRILLRDACTKDVFREMDGFLVALNVLSTLHTSIPQGGGRSAGQVTVDVLEATRLVFLILADAMDQHKQNKQYFKSSVGFESLSQAILGLLANSRTMKQTLGYLVSFSLCNFSLSGLFKVTSGTDYAQLDKNVTGVESTFGFIQHPEALRILYLSLPPVSAGESAVRYSILKLLERLSHRNHRNHCVLNSLGLVQPLFRDFCEGKSAMGVPKQERQVAQKLLRRIVDVGTTTDEAKLLFQRVIRDEDTLDADVLEILRAGMKVRWPEHFSLESSAALRVSSNGMKGLPTAGLTFMVWLWIENYPVGDQLLFSFCLGGRNHIALGILRDGTLRFQSSGSNESAVFKTTLSKSRWTHVTVVHHPHRAANATIRLFVDGVLTDSLNWMYPRTDATATLGTYLIGDSAKTASMSWCIASAYLLSIPLANHIPRLIHHLGPRYTARFQAADLVKFLTYEASTALNVYLSAGALQQPVPSDVTQLMNSIKYGLGVNEAAILFVLSPAIEIPNVDESGSPGIAYAGDVFAVKSNCLDLAMWKLGGAAIALRLVQLASNPHEVSRALGILSDGVRNSWQNSEDMERFRGYEILAEILHGKSHHINMTGFETLFEFLGLNFRAPDHSTVVNTVAYRALALDFQLWSSTRKEIQQVHLEHFATLLQTSKHKRFNVKQRLGKMGVVRKMLFVLQTAWYQQDMIPLLVDAIKVVAEAHFSTDDAIKPIVSYLAANLHEVETGLASPRSAISRIDHCTAQSKAEQVLEMLVTILHSQQAYTKFANALPLPRICLLLLGERPSSMTAIQILRLIGISLDASSSFSRKFELVSGWGALKVVLPHAWDKEVQQAVFDLLLGRLGDKAEIPPAVSCPQIVPAIFFSLKVGLETVAGQVVNGVVPDADEIARVGTIVEQLLERLIEVHSTVPTFRQVFKLQATTQLFIDAYRSFVASVSMFSDFALSTTRILEKLSHLGLSIALDTVVTASQKEEIMEILQSAETALNPRTTQESCIDSAALVGHKPRRRRTGPGRLSIQLSESTVKRSVARLHAWRKTVIMTERKRLRKTILDLREHHRQVTALTEWATQLTAERGLWAYTGKERYWRLDETEGPYRVRKKLEPAHENPASSKVDTKEHNGNVHLSESDSQSLLPAEPSPWHDSYEVSSSDGDEHHLEEEIVEDKHRRVRHELEPGDVIEAANTVARVSGVDSSPGLFIFGRTHLYMLDGLVEDEYGEIIDAHDAPKKLFFVPGSNVALDGPQRAHRWTHDQVVSFCDRTFLFRDVALEIYFKDSRSLLVVFLQKSQRQEMNNRLSSILARMSGDALTPGVLMSPLKSPLVGRLSARLSATLSARVMTGLRLDELSTAQRKWQTREISNFTYLSILNQISGRTPNDATQYPVFPWVVSDYASPTLNLRSSDSFRDLSRPMGALTPARRDAAHSRYVNLESVGEKPFHYGIHFSSSMIVCHFLIRLEPFSHMFKTLQGGDWDLPDRLFSDVKRAYDSASQDIRGDVRELLPEFYACPEFLENSSNFDFGVQQNTGERIHDVKLPPWAKQDPLLFIVLNREALESDYVSEYLPQWIDLIWGCKQRDPESLNVFHPLSYEGSIDLDTITDELEREATVGIIHNFGQTPRKIFHTPHPARIMHGSSSLPLGTLYGIAEDYLLLTQADKPTKDLGPNYSVRDIMYDFVGQRAIPCWTGMLCIPSRPHEYVEWETGVTTGGALKVVVDRKVVQVIGATFCSCAAFADADTLVTGSLDHTVRLWRVCRGSSGAATPATPRFKETSLSLNLTHIMRAHTAGVTCVTASRGWSLVVSGSKDGSAALWDLNRGVYVRSIWHGSGEDSEVHLVAINESTGYIATCSREKLYLHTVNARPIACLDLTPTPVSQSYPPITSIAFLEREYSRVGVLATGTPDGSITLWTWNTDQTPDGQKAIWNFVTLRMMKVKDADGGRQSRGYTSCVTALKFVGEILYHGEDTGKVFAWNLPD